MNMKKVVFGIVVALMVFIGLPILWGSWYTVSTGEKAIIKTWGAVSDVKGDGLHFKIPFAQSVEKVDVRTKKAHSPSEAGSKDMQSITTEVSLNYHLNENKLKEIYFRTGVDIEDKIIDPRIQEDVKAVIAKFSADQLLAQREIVKGEIEKSLKTSLSAYDVVVEAVQITNFKFSKAYNDAIEMKQVAEQSALTAKNDLLRINIEAEQTISKAKAEAEAIRIQAQAIKENGGKEFVTKLAVEKWDGKLPTYMGGNTPVPFLDIK